MFLHDFSRTEADKEFCAHEENREVIQLTGAEQKIGQQIHGQDDISKNADQ